MMALRLLSIALAASSASALQPVIAPAPKSPAARLWAGYLDSLEAKPTRTKMATAAILSGTGDCIAQSLTPAPFVLKRLVVIMTVNVVYLVPVLTAFYAANERLADALRLPGGWRRTGAQLAFDQLVNAPIVIAGFFTSFQIVSAIAEACTMGILPNPRTITAAIASQLRTSYLSTVISNWQVWVLPQLLNFAFVPIFARVAFANAVALVWNVVLSVIANS